MTSADRISATQSENGVRKPGMCPAGAYSGALFMSRPGIYESISSPEINLGLIADKNRRCLKSNAISCGATARFEASTHCAAANRDIFKK